MLTVSAMNFGLGPVDRLSALPAEVGLALVGVVEPFTAPAARALPKCLYRRQGKDSSGVLSSLRCLNWCALPIFSYRASAARRRTRRARRSKCPAGRRPLCQSSHDLSSLISVALVPVGIALLPVKIVGTEDALLRLVDLYAPVFSLIALRESKPSLIE